MKCLILLALIVPCYGLSQSINGVKIADIPVQYARIMGESMTFKTKQFVYIDFGEQYGDSSAKLTDDKGQPIEFKSMTDALNFMGKLGFELDQAYGYNNGSTSFYHYIMKRKP